MVSACLRTCVCVFVFCCADALTYRANVTVDAPAVDVYVINLPERVDKCLCMQKQLASAPVNVHKFVAGKGNTCNLKKAMSPASAHTAFDVNAQASLFCSNYHIWELALHSAADAIVILEDDVQLAPNWFQKVTQMIQTVQLRNRYVVVDPINSGNAPEWMTGSGSIQGIWGTHMTILPKAILGQLVELANREGHGIMDVWYKEHWHEAWIWNPKIVSQASQPMPANNAQAACPDSVRRTDIPRRWGFAESKFQMMICS